MVQLPERGVQQLLARNRPGRALGSVGVVPRVPSEAQCEEAAPPEVVRNDRVLRAPMAVGSS